MTPEQSASVVVALTYGKTRAQIIFEAVRRAIEAYREKNGGAR